MFLAAATLGWGRDLGDLVTPSGIDLLVEVAATDKDINSGDILWVNICISSYVNKGVLVRVQNVLQARVKTGEGREKFIS
jgi:hypothetical protein